MNMDLNLTKYKAINDKSKLRQIQQSKEAEMELQIATKQNYI